MRKLAYLFVGLAAAVTTALPAAPRATAASTYWGAIAVSDWGSIGSAWDYPSPSAAKSAALSSCGDYTCEVLTTFVDCGAVSYSYGYGSYTGGNGASRYEAESDSQWYSDSYVIKSICN
ncbi:DUF4189 domain-containing protein [Nocardia sp. NPDC058658]|uniref:DUF4189 domain-containing protein n=1 Tax=Nocardia sp. NPDC058658 TaxID=3346580 RepID=UPI003664F698